MIDLKRLSKSVEGTQLYEFLEEVKYKVADVRTPITGVEMVNELAVRRGICELVDDLIINRLRTADTPPKADDNWV